MHTKKKNSGCYLDRNGFIELDLRNIIEAVVGSIGSGHGLDRIPATVGRRFDGCRSFRLLIKENETFSLICF